MTDREFYLKLFRVTYRTKGYYVKLRSGQVVKVVHMTHVNRLSDADLDAARALTPAGFKVVGGRIYRDGWAMNFPLYVLDKDAGRANE